MMVNLTNGSETVEKAREYIDEQGYTFPVYYDTGLEAYTAYSLNAIPRTMIILNAGTVFRDFKGAMSKTTLYSMIEGTLAKSE